ncbi:MAG: hypothetical protein HYZ39_16340 [Mycolicibacterium cosmeticum]|nr:hypothetical protein [Mycolicibacterium cosmeticum]
MGVTTIVVAETVIRAQNIVVERGLGRSALAVSPRSIVEYYAGRGLTGVTRILVDSAVWPLDDAALDELMPCTFSSPVPVAPTMITPLGGVTQGVSAPPLMA